jgi:hypothetical protein
MEESNSHKPHEKRREGKTQQEKSQVKQDLAQIDRMANPTEHALPDHIGFRSFLSEHNGQAGLRKIAGQYENKGGGADADGQRHVCIQKRGISQEKGVGDPGRGKQTDQQDLP